MPDDYMEGEHEAVERRSSVATEDLEYEPLLGNGVGPSLYKTLSHVSTKSAAPDSSEDDVERANSNTPRKSVGVYATLSVLLLGVFISQTDHSFVLATYGVVSSEFDDLGAGSWLISSYILASCVAQPLYGKMSDIYGRKLCLQTSYVLFSIGTAVSGLGQNMGQVIAGRAIQGAGGAGMVSMVSIIITDLVPLNEVASLWSYVNILQTTGRSAGGFLGGLLTQTLGWRLAFLIQIPPIVLAFLLVQWRLHLSKQDDDAHTSKWEKLRRVDFVGAFFLCYTIFAACFLLDTGGRKYPWDSPIIVAIIVSGIVTALCFVISAKRVKEPIFPLRLIAHYDLATNYLIVLLQIMVQMSLMMSVPLYFQATKHASTAAAGAYLIPAFIGNTLGGLLSGYWIRRTGRYKWPTVAAPILSVVCMLLCLFTWNGNTSVWMSFFIFPGGFATGMIVSSAFVGSVSSVPPEDVAVAGSGMYLIFNVGAIAGASGGGAAYQSGLRAGLRDALKDVKGQREASIHAFSILFFSHKADSFQKIIQRLQEDIKYLWTLSEELRRRIMPAYVRSFHSVNMLGLVCAILSLVIAIFTRGKRLTR